MIQVKRKQKAVKNKKRQISIEEERKIAEEYFNSDLRVAEIAKKYNKKATQVHGIIQGFEPIPPNKDAEEKQEKLLLIDSRDYEFALFLLAEYGTRYREPENFTYKEKFNSSMNAE